jgi:hypothetical protein
MASGIDDLLPLQIAMLRPPFLVQSIIGCIGDVHPVIGSVDYAAAIEGIEKAREVP